MTVLIANNDSTSSLQSQLMLEVNMSREIDWDHDGYTTPDPQLV